MHTCQQLGQVHVLLLMRGIAYNLVDAQVAVRAIAQAHRAGRPAQLLQRHALLEVRAHWSGKDVTASCRRTSMATQCC